MGVALAEGERKGGRMSVTNEFQQYRDYVSAIFRPGDTLCFVGIEHETNQTGTDFIPFEEAIALDYFRDLQETNKEASIYLATNSYPASLIGSSLGRTQENVVAVRALQADVDHDGESTMAAIQSSHSVPKPSIVVESSTGKYQGIWLVDDIDKAEAKPLMQAIATEFHTDSAVADTARVMRVPGFVNRKYDTAPVAHIVSQTNKRYRRDDFKVQTASTTSSTTSSGTTFEQRVAPKEYLEAPFIRQGGPFGGIYNQVAKIIGHYISSIKNPDAMFHLVKGVKEDYGCFLSDGKTPYEWDEDKVRQQVVKQVAEWKDQGYRIAMSGSSSTASQSTAAPQQTAAAQPIEITPELLLKEFPAYDGTEPDELPMLIEGFMPKGVGFFGSLSGTGKTWVGLSVAKALTGGKPLWGVFPVQRPVAVLYLIPEASDASFKRRLGKMKITQNKNLFRYRTITQGITRPLSDPVTVAMIKQLGEKHDVIVIVDTAVRFFQGGDENAAKENNLVQDSDMLRSIGANVLFLHHSPKATKDAAELTLENALRGTGDFGAMADFVYAFRRDEKMYAQGEGPEEIEVVCVKPRDFEPPLPFRLQLKRKAQHGEPGGIVSVIDLTGDLGYVGHAAVKNDHEKLLADIFHENPFISFNDLVNQLKMKRELVRGFCKRNGGWKQVSEPTVGARGKTVTRKKWTQGLVMAGQVEQTYSAEPVQPGPPPISLNAIQEDISVAF
jgi:AAA domain/RepB DNA-primase from phage plasmid